MKINFSIIATILLFVVLAYAFFIFDSTYPLDKTFLSISTFLFSIFTGFFISRQASRYGKIRETVATFDGKLTTVYRLMGHIGKDAQQKTGQIIKSHYEKIFASKQWNYHFNKKSNTITSIHQLIEETIGDEKIMNLKNQSLGGIIKSLAATQDLRKNMVALEQENIPLFQWFLIYFFMAILLFTVATIPSSGLWFASVLKAAFSVSVFSVIIILHKLDHLKMFGTVIGNRSAKDVLGIVSGEK